MITIVFVHGIFSSCEVFGTLRQAIVDRLGEDTVNFLDFNYPYLEPLLSNGRQMNEFLHDNVEGNATVAIIAHSMGGLVSRLALLSDPGNRHYNIRYLIMLGTPNHGALRLGQLRGLAALAKQAVGKLPILYSRSRGLDDLTRVNTIVNELINSRAPSVIGTQFVDYVTIPSTFYNEDHPYLRNLPRSITDRILDWIAFMSAHTASVKLSYAHDGVVEEASVRMVTSNPLDLNERTYYATEEGRMHLGRTAYLHIVHPDCREGNHVRIHSIPAVCRIVAGLLDYPGIDGWLATIPIEERTRMILSNGQ